MNESTKSTKQYLNANGSGLAVKEAVKIALTLHKTLVLQVHDGSPTYNGYHFCLLVGKFITFNDATTNYAIDAKNKIELQNFQHKMEIIKK